VYTDNTDNHHHLLVPFSDEVRMKTNASQDLEIHSPKDGKIVPIRTESVLCQYPIHKLAKDNKSVQIRLMKPNEDGKTEMTWKVSPNAEYGHPGELSYDIDTLVINRLIDQLYPDIPEFFQIADSLSQISEMIGKVNTRDTTKIKNALYQNAFAAITARINFLGKDKKQRRFEFGSTRYGVVFAGERLPNGERADAIFIVLNPLFRELLRNAKRRPLDYDYLKALPPAARRWYELVSFQIFAALNLGNPRARYLYSDLCDRVPMSRFFTWEKAKKQLYKIHRPHLLSGYISKVEVEQRADEQGRPDWFLWYTPGKKANREFLVFNERQHLENSGSNKPLRQLAAKPKEVMSRGLNKGAVSSEDSALIEKLMSFGIEGGRAARLVENDREEAALWADAWRYQIQKGMQNPPAVLITFIENKRRPLPQKYLDAIRSEQRKRDHEANHSRQMAEDLHYQYFGPSFRAYLKQKFFEIESVHSAEHKVFMDYLEKSYARQLQMIQSPERREEFAAGKALEFFNDSRPGLGVRLPTFDEWNETENRDNSDPLTWFEANPGLIETLLNQ